MDMLPFGMLFQLVRVVFMRCCKGETDRKWEGSDGCGAADN